MNIVEVKLSNGEILKFDTSNYPNVKTGTRQIPPDKVNANFKPLLLTVEGKATILSDDELKLLINHLIKNGEL